MLVGRFPIDGTGFILPSGANMLPGAEEAIFGTLVPVSEVSLEVERLQTYAGGGKGNGGGAMPMT